MDAGGGILPSRYGWPVTGCIDACHANPFVGMAHYQGVRGTCMDDVSVLIGGKAGDGINSAGMMAAQLLNHAGYSIYGYFDYPSLIRGGHNFTIIRGSCQETSPGTCREGVDFLLALDQATTEIHRGRMDASTVVIFNADVVRSGGQGIPVREILAAENAPAIMGNSAIIGGFAKTAGIGWDVVRRVFTAQIPRDLEKNLATARDAYDRVPVVRPVKSCTNPPRALLTGNEAIGLGLILGGLDAYVSYPMTPSSGLLHFLAAESGRFGIRVVHPENEIAVILMALGLAAGGKRAAVGTSGGGFCLMTEGLSFAGMAEIPVVIVMSQRTGPSTGLPTYTGQADLAFVLHAGQGEFPRLIVAPGDASEAVLWSARALDLAWRCQVPAFVLADKTLSEGTYSTVLPEEDLPAFLPALPPAGAGPYRRYALTPDGISPLSCAGAKGAVVKVNSYAHDEDGITTEDAAVVERMAGKRAEKGRTLAAMLESYGQVVVSGEPHAATALLSWGSTAGVCSEVGRMTGLRVVRPVVLQPFPLAQIATALAGVTRLIAVEENATGQLADLAQAHGIVVHDRILRFDGRPFTAGSLAARVREVTK